MAEEKRSANDISQIRELIFGDKIREYDRHFAQIDETLNKINDALRKHDEQLATVQKDLQQASNSLTAKMESDISRMQKEWEETKKQILRKLEELANDKADRLKMGNYLIELGMRLKDENMMEQILEQSSNDGKR